MEDDKSAISLKKNTMRNKNMNEVERVLVENKLNEELQNSLRKVFFHRLKYPISSKSENFQSTSRETKKKFQFATRQNKNEEIGEKNEHTFKRVRGMGPFEGRNVDEDEEELFKNNKRERIIRQDDKYLRLRDEKRYGN